VSFCANLELATYVDSVGRFRGGECRGREIKTYFTRKQLFGKHCGFKNDFTGEIQRQTHISSLLFLKTSQNWGISWTSVLQLHHMCVRAFLYKVPYWTTNK